jgi:hypothetical protein
VFRPILEILSVPDTNLLVLRKIKWTGEVCEDENVGV